MKRGKVANRLLDRYVGIAALGALSIVNRRRMRPAVFRTIGILASPTVGDTLLTSGAVLGVRRAFPSSRITYFCALGGSRAAVKLIPGIDAIQPIEITKPFHTIQIIRKCKLDLIIDFSQWQRTTALFSGLSGARYRLGFRSNGQFRHWLYDEAVQHSRDCHEIDNFRALVRPLGVRMSSAPVLNVAVEAPGVEKPEIVFHPWATGDRAYLREWDTENWVELARRLAVSQTLFVITGTRAELPRSEHLVKELERAGLSATLFPESNGLDEVSRQLVGSELVVSVNTGIMHLAALLGVRTISLNGPTATHRWGPVGPRTRSVEPQGGGGGFLHFGFEFRGNPEDTMRRILVDDVVAAAQTLVPRLQGAVAASA
jgi:heptosyltransferase-3